MPQRAIYFVLPSWAQRGALHRLGVCEDKLLLPLLILGLGLGQSHSAEPHKLPEGSTQTRPTYLTLW